MDKDKRSAFPPAVTDHRDAAKLEAEKVSAKIDHAFKKLAKKMRERADTAKAKLNETTQPEKRVILLRRFELYADAATHLEEHFSHNEN